jgi:hypothetical protein
MGTIKRECTIPSFPLTGWGRLLRILDFHQDPRLRENIRIDLRIVIRYHTADTCLLEVSFKVN